MTKFTNKPVLLFSFVFLQELQESRVLTNICMCRVDSTISFVWKAPLPIEGVLDYFLSSPCFFFPLKSACIKYKEGRPWSDATFCGVWSGFALFAIVPFMRR